MWPPRPDMSHKHSCAPHENSYARLRCTRKAWPSVSGVSGCRIRSTEPLHPANLHLQWAFPAPAGGKSETTEGRHHYHETTVQRAVTRAVRATGIDKRAYGEYPRTSRRNTLQSHDRSAIDIHVSRTEHSCRDGTGEGTSRS